MIKPEKIVESNAFSTHLSNPPAKTSGDSLPEMLR